MKGKTENYFYKAFFKNVDKNTFINELFLKISLNPNGYLIFRRLKKKFFLKNLPYGVTFLFHFIISKFTKSINYSSKANISCSTLHCHYSQVHFDPVG